MEIKDACAMCGSWDCKEHVSHLIKVPILTPDQAAYLEMLHQNMTDFIESAVVNGPREADGRVPDRECFWLVERNVSPPQYVSSNSAGWHSDPWQAVRFKTERAAHDFWRLMGESDRPQFKVIEHMFLNKPTP